MAINVAELTEWIKAGEGLKWLDSQKASLLENRDQVLSELKKTSGEYSELKQRFEETEKTLQSEKTAISKYLIDTELTALLNKANVFEEAIPRTIDTLKTAYGLTVKADGDNRTVSGVLKDESGKDTEAGLNEIVKHWTETPDAKYFIRATSSGGGAPGSDGKSAHVMSNFQGVSGPALAKMSDEEFNNIRNEQLQQTHGE